MMASQNSSSTELVPSSSSVVMPITARSGQKLIIVVMAVRNITHNTPPVPKTSIDPSPSPSPPLGTPPPPSESPVAKAPTSPPQSEHPRSGAPEPSVNPPGFEALAPAPTPTPTPTPTQSGTAPCFGGSADLVLGFSVVLGAMTLDLFSSD
ncbi:hypothetical protein F0562_010774 [Nyssa sinensis]|uniref:Uncharacterized protein n=1 Tax=Nyssa sinensis TaxID=561372 RepID=A0A5J5A4K7_9ASTE|nr:hypothetical protein F0562_010774 [Nyssa sinensis]